MIIQLTDRFSLGPVLERLDQLGLRAQVVQWEGEPLVVAPGGEPYEQVLKRVRGVASLHPAPEPYELASRGWMGTTSAVRVGPVAIGGGRPVLIASLAAACHPAPLPGRLPETARALAALGVDALYGGSLTPRATPYGTESVPQGVLQLAAEVRREIGLPFIARVSEPSMVTDATRYADMLEIAQEGMLNHSLLRAAGRAGKPVLLRRGAGAPLATWLLAAEFILAEGNRQVVLCEEGADGSDPGARRMLDITVIPRLARMTHLPVVVDASLGSGDAAAGVEGPAGPAAGNSPVVGAVARAALAAGADGVLLEATLPELAGIIQDLRPLWQEAGRLT